LVYDLYITTAKHHFSALALLCIAAVIIGYVAGPLRGMLLPEPAPSLPAVALLGVEAPAATKVEFDFYRKHSSAVFNVTHNAKQPIYVSLPENWWRREVSNTALDRVVADATELQTKRWRIPSAAEVSFAVPNVPDVLEVASPQQSPVMINLEYIDIAADIVERTSVLVQERGEIWRAAP